MNKKQEEIIKRYFQSWIQKDDSLLGSIFDEDVVYIECYGPEYHGIAQITQWFNDWNQNNSVLEWTIKNFIYQGNITVVEWFFKCRCGNEEDGFDGVSLVKFDNGNKIVELKEFQSKSEHYYPYGK